MSTSKLAGLPQPQAESMLMPPGTSTTGGASNLSNIYQNLNNYQAMIDNLEQQQTHQRTSTDILNQSRYREYNQQQQLDTSQNLQ